jgi:3-dehydroquinate dehydratase II
LLSAGAGILIKFLVINGPNLNMLGIREPHIYGGVSYDGLVDEIRKTAVSLDISVTVFQSNSEGELIDEIQKARDNDGIIINAGGYTHSSVAIRDALLSTGLPVVEVHLSNIFSREDFRKKSYISDIAVGVITGFGMDGYRMGMSGLKNYLTSRNK